ncbi:MAG: hypothetical protein M1835_008009 [Candelina submexicana]|nr:MAG: hypothetical protein M1835_008009 [Candelina submexicana]
MTRLENEEATSNTNTGTEDILTHASAEPYKVPHCTYTYKFKEALPGATAAADADIEPPWTVEKKLAKLHLQPQTHSSSPVPFFHLLERLKTTKRAGWERFHIHHGESISDHMYRMSLLTMFAPPSLASRLDIPHCTKMALVHDMAESIVGDITPIDGIEKEEKSRRESISMDYLCGSLLGNVWGGMTGNDLRQIWQEYEDGQTLEAKYVHDIDKMELILQMLEYEKRYNGGINLIEFTWVAKRINLPEVRAWCDEVLDDREQFWKRLGTTSKDVSHTGAIVRSEEYYGNGTA